MIRSILRRACSPPPLLLAAIAALCGCKAPRLATPAGDGMAVVDHALAVRVDNDSIGLGDSTDRNYTNGLELSWTPPMPDPNGAAARLVRGLPLFPTEARDPQLAFHFGQQMFTPNDIERPVPDPDDRPYAGWLYGAVSARNVQLGTDDERRDRFDEWRLDLGVVGPSSGADRVQVEWHEILDTRTPRGWATQLRDEPGVLLGYRRAARAAYQPWTESLAGDATLEGFARVGNVRVSAGLGAAVRAGYQLPRDFGTPARRIRRDALGGIAEQAPVPWSLYVIAGLRGAFVAYDIFLDGNTYQSSAQVDRNPIVAELYAGLELRLSEHARLSYTHVVRTPEFDAPSGDSDLQDFASVALLIDF